MLSAASNRKHNKNRLKRRTIFFISHNPEGHFRVGKLDSKCLGFFFFLSHIRNPEGHFRVGKLDSRCLGFDIVFDVPCQRVG